MFGACLCELRLCRTSDDDVTVAVTGFMRCRFCDMHQLAVEICTFYHSFILIWANWKTFLLNL